MRWTKRAESRLRVNNRLGQPVSYVGWQHGDMETENNDKEAMKAGKKPGKTRDRELHRSERRERRVAGKGGQGMGEWTGFAHLKTCSYRIAKRFYHLFPHKLMQVVDFPHIGVARVFLERLKSDFQSLAERSFSNWQMVMKACAWIRIELKRHECRAPGKSRGRCGKRPYRTERRTLVVITGPDCSLEIT